ncbi:Beta-xylosidase like protein [Verticillium longisporum]|uniref:Beta-xylosidase like protein n=1 Tax=Verticillium longisporum TaxID=100787 RepID=A0A8I2ZP59_VERLO|nr:Beta-xylosidase like protein [Verticillium longisporum]
MASGILRTPGKDIVDANGHTVLLRGTTLGGWMLMENFINGFPGRENQIRAALLKVLGKEKYDFFFDKFLEYFFTEKAPNSFLYSASAAFTLEGFKHSDRAIKLCAKYGIYTILDLHSTQGGQNQDWHCDSPTGYAAFWDHKHFQDRVINFGRDLAVDSWAYDDAHLQDGLFGPLHKWFEDNVPAQYSKKYPWQWRMHMHVFRGIRGLTMAEYMVQEWADYFKDKTFEELDALAASWKIENCLQKKRLNELLKLYAPMTSADKRLEGKVIQPSVEERTKAKETISGVGVFELAPDEKRKRIEKVEVTPVPVAA